MTVRSSSKKLDRNIGKRDEDSRLKTKSNRVPTLNPTGFGNKHEPDNAIINLRVNRQLFSNDAIDSTRDAVTSHKKQITV